MSIMAGFKIYIPWHVATHVYSRHHIFNIVLGYIAICHSLSEVNAHNCHVATGSPHVEYNSATHNPNVIHY